MNNFIKSTLIAIATAGTLTGPMVNSAFAQPASAEQMHSKGGEFAKKKYKVKGSWSVTQRDGQTFITLSDDFFLYPSIVR